MSIVRAPRPQSHFTQIRNEVARNEALSFRARGVLTYILSMPNDWRTTSEELAKHGPEGRDAIRTALNELEAVGHLVRRKIRGDDGRFTTDVIVYDEPIPVAERPQPTTRKRRQTPETDAPAQAQPMPDNPSPEPPAQTRETAGRTEDGLPVVGNLGVLQNTVQEHYEDSPPGPPTGGATHTPRLVDIAPTPTPKRRARSTNDPEFDAFWQAYPRGDGKADALKAFIKAVDKERVPVGTIMEGLARSEAMWRAEGREFKHIPYASSWLNGRRWEDEGPRTTKPAQPAAAARTVSPDDVARNMWENARGTPDTLVAMLETAARNDRAVLDRMIVVCHACYVDDGTSPDSFTDALTTFGYHPIGAVA